MKYIFVAGAPGSKWSSVVKNIYYSSSIDRSDYTVERTYWHDASGDLQLMHLGAYWDPGMEFGGDFLELDQMAKEECEEEFDRPFTENKNGIRIIKSHVFCLHLEFIAKTWPDCPIILVHRSDDACLGWWVKCGHFNITYPLYHDYYHNLREMATHVKEQNTGIELWRNKNSCVPVFDNHDLCYKLGLELPPVEYRQYYRTSDIRVEINSPIFRRK